MQFTLPEFNIDSWFWKVAIVATLLVVRECIRFFSPKEDSAPIRYKADPEPQDDTAKWLIETIDSAAIAIGLVLFVIQPFILQAFYIPSGSMEDTLRIGDRLLVSKLIYRVKEPQFQDVVVFKAPPDALAGSTSPEGTDFIKRCIGTPGDVIEVKDRQLYRNGQKIAEPYTKWTNPENSPGSSDAQAPDALSAPRLSYDMKIVDGAVYSRDVAGPYATLLWSRDNQQVTNQDEITNAKPSAVPVGKLLMLGDHRSNSNDGHVWGFVPRENVVGKAICVFWPPTRLGLVEKITWNQHKDTKTE